jgi:hypothetical protein
MNAEIQGLRKIYELAREKPALAASRLAMFGLVPAMIPYLWAKQQGKDVEARYKDTPAKFFLSSPTLLGRQLESANSPQSCQQPLGTEDTCRT